MKKMVLASGVLTLGLMAALAGCGVKERAQKAVSAKLAEAGGAVLERALQTGAETQARTEGADRNMVFTQNGNRVSGTDEQGNAVSAGLDWPDNEFTRQIPKPAFAKTEENKGFNVAGDEGFGVMFSEANAEQLRSYTDALKQRGFTAEAESSDTAMGGMVMYSYKAKNQAGYWVNLAYMFGAGVLSVSKEKPKD